MTCGAKGRTKGMCHSSSLSGKGLGRGQHAYRLILTSFSILESTQDIKWSYVWHLALLSFEFLDQRSLNKENQDTHIDIQICIRIFVRL